MSYFSKTEYGNIQIEELNAYSDGNNTIVNSNSAFTLSVDSSTDDNSINASVDLTIDIDQDNDYSWFLTNMQYNFSIVRWLGAFRERENISEMIDFEVNTDAQQSAECCIDYISHIHQSNVGLLISEKAFIEGFEKDCWSNNSYINDNKAVTAQYDSLLLDLENCQDSDYIYDLKIAMLEKQGYNYDELFDNSFEGSYNAITESFEYPKEYYEAIFLIKLAHNQAEKRAKKEIKALKAKIKAFEENHNMETILNTEKDCDGYTDYNQYKMVITENELERSYQYHTEVFVNKKDCVKAIIVKKDASEKAHKLAAKLSQAFNVEVIADMYS